MRAEYDAILVGINTILQDNPSLNVRRVTGKNPYRIILDDNLAIPVNANIFKLNDPDKTIIFTSKSNDDKKFQQLSKKGIQLVSMSSNEKK